MVVVAVQSSWDFLRGAFQLNPEAFQQISTASGGLMLALAVVAGAGLSIAIAQSIILFINQVKPARFVFSLLLNVVLFTAGFVFLVFSTWLITLLPWSTQVSFFRLVAVLGLSYAPILFGFLGSLPYLGSPLLSLLSVWHLLAMVVGFEAVTGTGLTQAFGYVAFGWLVLQVLQQTIGRPIADLGRRLANRVAGVELITSRREVAEVVRSRGNASATDWQQEFLRRVDELRQGDLVGALTGTEGLIPSTPAASVGGIGTVGDRLVEGSASSTRTTSARRADADHTILKTLVALIGIALLTFLVVIFLRPVRDAWFGWYTSLPRVLRFVFNLGWIGVIALVVAGLLAPLETLGWWAGWYDDEVDTTVNAGELAQPVANPKEISRYVVYLDGIGKSTFEYLPDIEDFLNGLAPTLPEDVALVRGIMPYSVMNNPLVEDRPLAFLWKLADRNRYDNPADLLGLLVNLRNVLIVGVSADRRYGPLYNQGIAQVVFNGLLKNGYQLGSGIPVTLIGYSGGGQMACACAPFLKKALRAPIDVISLGGVISANCNFLALEHLYHLSGQKDSVERIGAVMFPGRWKWLPLSYWNRAKRRGKISFFDMGDVGHQVPGGILDPKLVLSDGRSSLQHTIDTINGILKEEILPAEDLTSVKLSNYEHYIQAGAFNCPSYYPIQQSLSPEWYRPIGNWMGRLILPKAEERKTVRGVLFEVYHTDTAHQHLVGQIVQLRWNHDPIVQMLVRAVKQDIHFSAEASYTSKYGGMVHPDRLNHWLQVGPLESLAGSRPEDDIIVMLNEPVEVEGSILRIGSQPVQISGRFYALVQFLESIANTDQFRVVHFNRASRQFDGLQEVIRLPAVVKSEEYGSTPSTTRDLEKSLLNETGWYIYGAQDASGMFVVQSLGLRALFRLQPDEVVFGKKASYHYIRKRAWADAKAQKGRITSVLCAGQLDAASSAIQSAIDEWQEGDRALVVHTYGGIGGNHKEPAAATPIFFGHFAFGLAIVIREPLANELRFDLRYEQVYTHNTDGIIAGTLHWSRYMGDRQFGWLGNRPVCDLLIKQDAFTKDFDFNGVQRSALYYTLMQLQVMTARYRTGDGTGGTYVGPANNCAQDSNQALFASLKYMENQVRANVETIRQWQAENPAQAERFEQLLQLGHELRQYLQPLSGDYSAWERGEFNLGSSLEDQPLRNLINGLGSWRTMFPRYASDTVVRIFLKYNASVWVLRTNQVGGYDPDIEPITPMTL
ncbi:CAAX protease [Egbenema bharatensis]|uniref:CAAX protease n=1 Tax=Egbenema bharatensis TaxID=3463334 RepID=UPI003A85BD16